MFHCTARGVLDKPAKLDGGAPRFRLRIWSRTARSVLLIGALGSGMSCSSNSNQDHSVVPRSAGPGNAQPVARQEPALLAPQIVPAEQAGPTIGQIAPEISGEDIDGETCKLSDYRGKVVVLDFWGNW